MINQILFSILENQHMFRAKNYTFLLLFASSERVQYQNHALKYDQPGTIVYFSIKKSQTLLFPRTLCKILLKFITWYFH